MKRHRRKDSAAHRREYAFLSQNNFYILSGEAIMQFKNEAVQLKVGTGIKIDPMEAHQMRNVSYGEMNFIVVFTPKSHRGRELV